MLQNQIDQKLMHNQIFQEKMGRLSLQCAKRMGTNPGYYHPSNEKGEKGDVAEVTINSHEDLTDYKLLSREQRRIEADKHEHPYECENSPWRKQQKTGSVHGNSTYTNKY